MKNVLRSVVLVASLSCAALPCVASTPGLQPGDDLLSPSPEITKDEFNRITSVTSATGERTTYEYFEDDPRSLMKAATFPDGTRQEYTHTAALFAHAVLLPFMQGPALPDHDLCAHENRTGFQGYFYSCLTKLYYTPSGRWYDPDTARFQQQDSYEGKIENPPSLHRYYYGYQNPTRYTDPSGHCPEGCDPLYNAPPEVQQEVARQQQQMISNTVDAAGNAAQRSYESASDAMNAAQAELKRRYDQGVGIMVTEGRTLSKASNDVIDQIERRITSDPSAYQVGMEWVTGQGPRNRHFGPGDTMTQQLQQTPEVERARELARTAIENDQTGPLKWRGRNLGEETRTSFVVGFVEDVLGRNPTRAYLGSYKGTATVVSIDPVNQIATVEFRATNESSLESATRLAPKAGYELDRPSLQHEVAVVGGAAEAAPGNFVMNVAQGQGLGPSYQNAKSTFEQSVTSVNPRGDFIPKSILSNDPFGVTGPFSTVTQMFQWREQVRPK